MQPTGSLEDVGILDLIRWDDRPTFILEIHAQHLNSQIVFRNHALDEYIEQYSEAIDFECWAISLDLGLTRHKKWTFAGRVWANTFIQERWIVVYCSQTEYPQTQLAGGAAHQSYGTLQFSRDSSQSLCGDPSTSIAHKVSQIFSDPGDTIPHFRDVIPTFPSLMYNGNSEPKIIDWTRHSIDEGLPPYIRFMKQYDWASTPLGPMSMWPDSLRRVVICTFSNPEPRLLIWGKDMILLYNEAAVPRIGHRHPAALGRPGSETFAELWPHVCHIMRLALFEGKATQIERELYFTERNGILEETYWSFVMAPLLGDNGYAEGVLDTFMEKTMSIVAQRRKEIVVNLTLETSKVTTLKELWSQFLRGFGPHGIDVPYAIIYSADDGESPASPTSQTQPLTYKLEATVGINREKACLPPSFEMADPVEGLNDIVNACRRARHLKQTVTLRTDEGSLPEALGQAIPGRGWGDMISTVCVMPVAGSLAFLIIALNPRRPVNDESTRFAHNLRDILAKPAWLFSQQRSEEIQDSLAQQLKVSTLKATQIEERFKNLAESSPIGICTFGRYGETLYVNSEYLSMIGVPRENNQETLWDRDGSWQELVLPEDLPRIQETWKSLVEQRIAIATMEYRIKKRWHSIDKSTGKEISGDTWVLNKAATDVDDEGNIVYIHAWLLDVSAQHHAEGLMADRLEDALENKRQSENFIDMVSHELRNPLSAILQSADGILTVLDETPIEDISERNNLRENVSESAQTIVLCAQHQKCIVDDILTLSKLDSNLLVITPDKVQPPNLIDKVLKMYEAELLRTGVSARLDIDSSFTEILHDYDYIMLDPSRLLQVVINLLTNAIKFTQFSEERKITIHLSTSYETPSGAAHHLTYIEPLALRSNPMPALSPEWGSGQDLYLQLAVQDTGRGLGPEEIEMLFQRFSQTSPKTYKQYGGSGLGLFISRELTELQGGQIGVSSKGIGKGSTFAFYVRARKCIPEESEDSTSTAALQSLCLAPATVSPVPTLVVDTSSEGHLIPERPRLSRVPTSSRSLPSADTRNKESGSLHVLIVEDNLINQKVMAQQLRRIGCVVHIANHGLECLDFLRGSTFWKQNPSDLALPSDHIMPNPVTPLSIVLMDWEMPTMDGLTCVREIRKFQASGDILSHVPVIAVTANARNEQIAVAMKAGMDDLVTKPFKIPDLVPQMEALVALHIPSPANDLQE